MLKEPVALAALVAQGPELVQGLELAQELG
jgi:hypothetical protein